MNKADEVLVAVAEAHATTYPTLEERCRTREAEGYHTLVLIPDIHHPIQPRLIGLHDELPEQVIPPLAQFSKRLIYGFGGGEALDECLRFLFVEQGYI